MQPDAIRGIRTRWRTGGGNTRYTVQPYLEGLGLAQWVRSLEELGVNLADINVDPSDAFARQQVVDVDRLRGYLAAYYTPAVERASGDADLVESFERSVIGGRQLTAAQRDLVILDFLQRLEDLKDRGEIKGTVRFILHQRQWFRPGAAPRLVQLREDRARDYAEDMAGIINAARAQCLDHWLAGIRLGENFNTDMDEFLPVLVSLASGTNRLTGGWLKKRLFLSNGGDMGADYRGIARPAVFGGDPNRFFADMAAETGSFAFGYKWMRFLAADDRSIRDNMARTPCQGGSLCDVGSTADWRYYLGSLLGLDELMQVIDAAHRRYPNHANVMFVGDSSDSVTLMVQRDGAGTLAPSPPLSALLQLWQGRCQGRSGYEFMNGFSSRDTASTGALAADPDQGFSLFFVDGAQPRALPASTELWRNWLPACR